MKSISAATNSSSTRFSAVIWQLCSWPSHVSPSQDFLWEAGKLLSYLTVSLACLESGSFWTWKERTDWKNLSEESTSSVKILILLRAILTFDLVSGWSVAVAVFNTVFVFLQLTFIKKSYAKKTENFIVEASVIIWKDYLFWAWKWFFLPKGLCLL